MEYKNIESSFNNFRLVRLEKFFIEITNSFTILWNIFVWIFLIIIKRKKIDKDNLVSQFYEVGVKSLPIIFITAFSTGMVLALQLGLVMKSWFGDPIFVGMSLSFTFAKELSPILTAIVISGRIGAAITAEIGTMKVTEQLDAMSSLGVHPLQYIAIPKFLSCIIMVPILSIFSYIISIIGGLTVATSVLKIPYPIYFADVFDFVYIKTILHGLIKAIFFGLIVAWISMYKGFNCEEGAEGVGKATTASVVLSIILILVSDYFLTSFLIIIKIF
ncbi:MAG: ABC transporter permease [Elusimicrobiota bacterium]|jgi:phospholipid/cholesterol/gamma-HCH transport system permease protein|nr:ABC transporter permease [Elusimicrobiota bacterium]